MMRCSSTHAATDLEARTVQCDREMGHDGPHAARVEWQNRPEAVRTERDVLDALDRRDEGA